MSYIKVLYIRAFVFFGNSFCVHVLVCGCVSVSLYVIAYVYIRNFIHTHSHIYIEKYMSSCMCSDLRRRRRRWRRRRRRRTSSIVGSWVARFGGCELRVYARRANGGGPYRSLEVIRSRVRPRPRHLLGNYIPIPDLRSLTAANRNPTPPVTDIKLVAPPPLILTTTNPLI